MFQTVDIDVSRRALVWLSRRVPAVIEDTGASISSEKSRIFLDRLSKGNSSVQCGCSRVPVPGKEGGHGDKFLPERSPDFDAVSIRSPRVRHGSSRAIRRICPGTA